MTAIDQTAVRVVLDGKFFRLGAAKFPVKGVTYGPFAPNSRREMFPEPEQARRDLDQIRELGANLLRVYYVPPHWLLDLAHQHGLKLLVDVPWPKHLCFLDSAALQREARDAVRQAVAECRGHPAVFAFSVVNEIPADIVRWSGPARIEAFIDELVEEAKRADPACLCTFTSFPPTEFLNPSSIDFLCFNVYLHDRPAFEGYLARLQMLADSKPLVLSEFGMDSFREGEAAQAEFLGWQIEAGFRGGLAGAVVFSYTDDWFRGEMQIEDWAFGLTTRDRRPKPAFRAVQEAYAVAPHFPLARVPRVSVVVASYNGGRTLQTCLESLSRLNYPDYEVILVDDGSTDNTQEIARRFENVCTIHHNNRGLSSARNTGLAVATGEVIAYTDSDCRADEDWLYYLISDLLKDGFVGIGGHNFLPPEDSLVAAAVMTSPGGPAHVMLTDREAEHIPGCNMAFFKWGLAEIGGFDPIFRKAGDDVDVCWRLQQRGYRIGFSPAGFVWHYRRSTVQGYLQQQNGYGEAETLLARKHPEYFNSIGRSIWRGRLYAPAKPGVIVEPSIIYHGLFGSGFFQKLYTPAPSFALMLCTSLEYHVLVTAPLFVVSAAFPLLLPLAVTSLGISLAVCGVAAAQAQMPKSKRRFWSRPLVALLFLMQPVERGLARYKASLTARSRFRRRDRRGDRLKTRFGTSPPEILRYWSKGSVDRYAFLATVLSQLAAEEWQARADTGWSEHDIEILGNRWSHVRLTTTSEELHQGKRNILCRLEPRWSLLAKVLFWGLLGAELFVIGLTAPFQPWIWMLLLSLPLVTWFMEFAQAALLETLAVLLDETAEGLGLVKLTDDQTTETKAVPAESVN